MILIIHGRAPWPLGLPLWWSGTGTKASASFSAGNVVLVLSPSGPQSQQQGTSHTPQPQLELHLPFNSKQFSTENGPQSPFCHEDDAEHAEYLRLWSTDGSRCGVFAFSSQAAQATGKAWYGVEERDRQFPIPTPDYLGRQIQVPRRRAGEQGLCSSQSPNRMGRHRGVTDRQRS